MPLNYKILENLGSTEKRLREILTAKLAKSGEPAVEAAAAANNPAEAAKLKEDCRIRTMIEDLLKSRINEAIAQSFKRYQLYSAADLAWDAAPLTGGHVPLMLYAQGRMSKEACAQTLDEIGCGSFVKRGPDGAILGVERPKFVMVDVNLTRSIITRRVAAQMNRFNNLWPFFKYEPRSTKPEAKLRADAVSQIADITADQFGYRPLQEQLVRDLMLYQHTTIFPTSKWQRDIELALEDVAEEFKPEEETAYATRIVREGVGWTVAHPSRTFFDSAHPRSSINTDTGCEWFGYWDVCRWGDIRNNPAFFNRDATGFNSVSSQYSAGNNPYFLQYFSRFASALAPVQPADSLSEENDTKSQVGRGAALTDDAPVFLTHFMWKLKPVELGIGKYPHPVWVHFTVAGDIGTVVHAEIMPDVPGVHFSYNGSDQRIHNLSIAHDLIGWQDAMNNMMNQLVEVLRRDQFTVYLLNTDIWDSDENAKKVRQQFIDHLTGGSFSGDPALLMGSFAKIKQLMGETATNSDNIFKVVRPEPNPQVGQLIQAMAQIMTMAERNLSLSPQEQGQVSPRETSATEVQIVATTTENVYSFISDAIDAGRAAWKRYIYNAWVSLGRDEIEVPVADRYPAEVIEAAGFRPVSDGEAPASYRQVFGPKSKLVEELIFNSRDGAERSSNVQAANVLTQLLQVILTTPAAGAIDQAKFFEIINEIARLGGSGVDLNLKPTPGSERSPLGPPPGALPPGDSAPQSAGPADELPQAPPSVLAN